MRAQNELDDVPSCIWTETRNAVGVGRSNSVLSRVAEVLIWVSDAMNEQSSRSNVGRAARRSFRSPQTWIDTWVKQYP